MMTRDKLMDTLTTRLSGSLQAQNLADLDHLLESELFSRLFWALNIHLRSTVDPWRLQLFWDISERCQ